jgi:hypothetical protein
MTGWRDLDVVRQPLPLDDWTADRLLAGMVDPDDAPPGYAGLARTLGQARGPVEAGELSGRELIVAAVTAAVADVSPPITVSTSPRRKSMFTRLFGTKLAAATLTTALLASGAAAATGSLPGPVQDVVSDVADRVRVALPVGDAEEETPASQEGRDAHAARDIRHLERDAAKAAAELIKEDKKTAKESAEAGEAETGGEQPGKVTPVSEGGQNAHKVRDERDALKGEHRAGEDAAAADEHDADKAERDALKETQTQERDSLQAGFAADKDALKAGFDADKDALRVDYHSQRAEGGDAEALEAWFEAEMAELEADFEAAMAKLEADYEAAMAEVEADYEAGRAQLEADQEAAKEAAHPEDEAEDADDEPESGKGKGHDEDSGDKDEHDDRDDADPAA